MTKIGADARLSWPNRPTVFSSSLMGQSPQALGYPHTDWTVPLLQQQLEKGLGLRPSDETVRALGSNTASATSGSSVMLRARPRPGAREKTADSPADCW